ncbi:hypothetical protein PbB2_03027 [Candidatus Phycosocius bacilliformis]|uniref:Uncharacterized protein n=1 Tax=Candidatus Phycosocius bacilliformis TaxID=1445552 RepID=A0A2P2EE41_9PROT|nr:hypothetical protein [Candidatus Phycosocius bacilliformis]GBF59332.1 hypothetical protein PbB2_03027 [Candidatus Phycosocius bacilliformis]
MARRIATYDPINWNLTAQTASGGLARLSFLVRAARVWAGASRTMTREKG